MSLPPLNGGSGISVCSMVIAKVTVAATKLGDWFRSLPARLVEFQSTGRVLCPTSCSRQIIPLYCAKPDGKLPLT